jgi:quinol-cytochrome oxidoreductase complex cytochrome b subunit
MKDALLRLELKEKSFITHLRMHHKVTFAFFVFFAINLLWYGMWGIIESIPILKNPMVSLVVGAMILIATGYFYDNLISSSFNKTRRKKKEVENKEIKP